MDAPSTGEAHASTALPEEEEEEGGRLRLPRLKLLSQNLCIAELDKHRLHGCTHALLQIVLFPPSPDQISADGRFFSFTQTPDEVSLVLDRQALDVFVTEFGDESDQPLVMSWERAWKAIRLHPEGEGDLGFDEPGIIDAVTTPLTAAQVPVFYISTFATDYLLVEDVHISKAVDSLRAAGFHFSNDDVVQRVVEEMGALMPNAAPQDSLSELGMLVQRNTPTSPASFGVSPTLHMYGSPTVHGVNMVIVRFHQELFICRFRSKASIKQHAAAIIQAMFFSGESRFFSYTETEDEISLLMDRDAINLFPEGALEQNPQPWSPLRISEGSVADVGIISKFTKPLAAAGISILNISTFSSDYAFVTDKDVEKSLACLRNELNLIAEDAAIR